MDKYIWNLIKKKTIRALKRTVFVFCKSLLCIAWNGNEIQRKKSQAEAEFKTRGQKEVWN